MKILKIFVITLAILLGLLAVVLYEGDIPKDVVDARYASPASQYLDLGQSGRIHYRDEGHRRHLPLVLLHGSNSSLHTWEGWVPELSENYRVISIDLPGHGLTGETEEGNYTQDAFIDVISAVAAELNLEKFVIAGNSMGGRTAWQYTLTFPEQIHGLILVNASGPRSWFENNDQESSVMVFNLLRNPWFRSVARVIDPYALTVQGLKAAYGDRTEVPDATIQRYYNLNLREGTRRATMDRFGQYSDDSMFTVDDLDTPTLILWGEQDSLIPVSTAKRFHDAIENSVLTIYEGVGHVPMEEIPVESAADVGKFLAILNTDS